MLSLGDEFLTQIEKTFGKREFAGVGLPFAIRSPTELHPWSEKVLPYGMICRIPY